MSPNPNRTKSLAWKLISKPQIQQSYTKLSFRAHHSTNDKTWRRKEKNECENTTNHKLLHFSVWASAKIDKSNWREPKNMTEKCTLDKCTNT